MLAFGPALRNIRRSPYQGLMATIMMSLVFFVSYVIVLSLSGAQMVLRYFESRPQVIAFFTVDTPHTTVESAADTMRGKSYVEKVKVVSKEEALRVYKDDNKKDPVLLELVTADIFPPSIEVSGKEITSLSKIRDDLTSITGVDDVVYQQDVIETLTRIIKNVRLIGIIAIAFFLVMSIMFIVVILSLRIALKRQEIGIMRLLGAGAAYIVGPYLTEGMLYGVVGAIVGWLGAFTLLIYLTPDLLRYFQGIIPLPVPPLFLAALLGAGLLAGASVGIIASFMAVKRFIRH